MFFTWWNSVALLIPKGKRNRENKLNLREGTILCLLDRIALILLEKKRDFNPHYQDMVKKGNYQKKLDFVNDQYNKRVISIDTYEQLLRCVERNIGVMDKGKVDEIDKKLEVVQQQLRELQGAGQGS